MIQLVRRAGQARGDGTPTTSPSRWGPAGMAEYPAVETGRARPGAGGASGRGFVAPSRALELARPGRPLALKNASPWLKNALKNASPWPAVTRSGKSKVPKHYHAIHGGFQGRASGPAGVLLRAEFAVQIARRAARLLPRAWVHPADQPAG